ncbi:hypothetical protein ACFY93_31305 [Streptomyces sp. NPDC008313]|uniref:hypothetical protein n=1 Tax=Streptomyces sp. NPDC008313 TaxID=3364826 RepID=UPI0036E53566
MVLVAAVFAVLQLANVTGRDTPDTKNYLSYALSLRGDGKREAAMGAVDYACAGRASIARRAQSVDTVRFHAPSPTRRVTATCRREQWREVSRRLAAGQTAGRTAPFMSERFMRIFEVRPGYPALLVPFVTVLGVTWGVWAAGVAVTVAGGALAFLVLRTLRAPPRAAVTGQVLFLVLPCGSTAMRPMTEGLLLALSLAALWGCALTLAGRRRTGAAVLAGSLVALFTVKHAQTLFLGVCLAGACAVAGALRGRRRARHGRGSGTVGDGGGPDTGLRTIAAVACCAAAGTLVAARLLHYPSETDSVQDLLTNHFAYPDRARPWREFLHLEADFWVEWLRRRLWEPLFLSAVLAAAWGALRQRPAFGALLLGAAGTGVLTQAAHPDINIWGDRLIVLVWLLPVVGLPLLLESAVRPHAAAAPPVPGTVPGPVPGSLDEVVTGKGVHPDGHTVHMPQTVQPSPAPPIVR